MRVARSGVEFAMAAADRGKGTPKDDDGRVVAAPPSVAAVRLSSEELPIVARFFSETRRPTRSLILSAMARRWRLWSSTRRSSFSALSFARSYCLRTTRNYFSPLIG